jgi:hypothetical protein
MDDDERKPTRSNSIVLGSDVGNRLLARKDRSSASVRDLMVQTMT